MIWTVSRNCVNVAFVSKEQTLLKFDEVSFGYGHNKPILDEVSFNLRRGSKVTLMGQNGAGKSTIFHIINGDLKPEDGQVHIVKGVTVGKASQAVSADQMEMTLREFFQSCFKEKIYDIDKRVTKLLGVVNLKPSFDNKIKEFSGGQKARLLLAFALIQNPDILLLDEPTNNLDKEGILHLKEFIKNYRGTCLVISHDADFLNSFTEGVLYLDIFTKKVEQYVGNYFDLLKEISARIERENRKNAQASKFIQANKDKINFFANKGGRMRVVAKKMKKKIEILEEEKVSVRREDKEIRSFIIPTQDNLSGDIVRIESFSVMNLKKDMPIERKKQIKIKKNERLLLTGPNGIGKSTLLNSIASGRASGVSLADNIKVGYYQQDFSNLDFNDSVYDFLSKMMEEDLREETIRSVGAGFLLTKDIIHNKIGGLSEGQKGLVAFAGLVLQRPGLLILDEPTNHINFRHIPVIAKALDQYKGAMILVSHVPEFVKMISIDEVFDLGK